MERVIQITADGSTTIHIPQWSENYHSKHGAIQESKHVFIKNGLNLLTNPHIAILEIGFGTGLNAMLTFLDVMESKVTIDYVGVEAYPILEKEVNAMNFADELNTAAAKKVFNHMHACSWEQKHKISTNFNFTKRKQRFEEIDDADSFDIIYFDAFGFRVQPELWSKVIFTKMYNALKSDGILVTYAARGIIKKNMIEAGFEVEKLPGPPGKREMFRARKESR